MTARKHHYVPQCYLKGFAEDKDKPQLFVIDGKEQRSFTTSIANIAAERDFHAIDVPGLRSDTLENAFSGFEAELSVALANIIATRSVTNQNDRDLLLNLIGLQAVKSPRHRETFQNFQEEILKKMLQMATATPERWASQMRQLRAAGGISDKTDTDYQKIKDFVDGDQFDITFPRNRQLALELKSFNDILPYIFSRKWMLLRAPPGSSGFVTSDHPMCLMWSKPEMRDKFFGPGLGCMGTQLLFPVCNELAIIGAFEMHDEERDASELMIAQINAAIILSSERQFYARDDNFIYKMEHNN